MEREKDCKYCDINNFKPYNPNADRIFICTSGNTNIFLHEDQNYFGRCVVATQRHVKSLSELTRDEQLHFFDTVADLEGALQEIIGQRLPEDALLHFNWTCLMNSKYAQRPPKPHVHWHFRPRYSAPFTFGGVEFTDPDFGQHYDRTRKIVVPLNVREQIGENIMIKLFEEYTKRKVSK